MFQHSGLSTIGDILRHRRLSLFGHVAPLDPGVPAHDALRDASDGGYLRRQKGNGQLEKTAGSPLNVWLNKIQEDANALLLSMLWRSEIARGHGAAQRSLGLCDNDDDDDDDDEGCKTCVKNGG